MKPTPEMLEAGTKALWNDGGNGIDDGSVVPLIWQAMWEARPPSMMTPQQRWRRKNKAHIAQYERQWRARKGK